MLTRHAKLLYPVHTAPTGLWGCSCFVVAAYYFLVARVPSGSARFMFMVYTLCQSGTAVINLARLYTTAPQDFIVTYMNFFLLMVAGGAYAVLGSIFWRFEIRGDFRSSTNGFLRPVDKKITHRVSVTVIAVFIGWLAALVPLVLYDLTIFAMIGWYTPCAVAALSGIVRVRVKFPVWQTSLAVVAGIIGMINFTLPVIPGSCSWERTRDGWSRLLDAVLYVPFVLPVLAWVDARTG